METKKTILLVEDDVALAAVYRSRLEIEGFDLREVHNGEEALAAALDFKPDLILLDAMMPKISGFDVLDILRNTPETADIRIVMLTALSQPKDKERAEALGEALDVDRQRHGSGSTSTGSTGIRLAGFAGSASTMNTSRSRLSRL